MPETPSEEVAEGEKGAEGEEFLLDEFALPEFVEEFGGIEEEEKQPEFAPIEEQPAAVEEPEAVSEEYTITDQQYNTLKRTLQALPINLKIPIEELIAKDRIKGKNLEKLLDLLTSRASASQIAGFVSKATGKKIILPRGFEKKAGEAFELERRTFAYAFRENIFPVLKGVVISSAILFLFAFLTYRFIYSPLHAISLYKQGYGKIQTAEYSTANNDFLAARKVWKIKSWYYQYAEAFISEKQFILAEGKYDQLLKDYPDDKKGILDYAKLETYYMANYKKAESLLNTILDKEMYNRNALLAAGDNYMAWGAEDPSKYEKARFSYASILDRYGNDRVALFRMMRYFIRTDKEAQAEKLYIVLNEEKTKKIDPEAYAELAGYFIDKGKLEHVQDILFKALDEAREMPLIHYELARYYRKIGEMADEKAALDTTLTLLNGEKLLNRDLIKIKIDTYDRLGEFYSRQNEVIRAEEKFQKAKTLIESSQGKKILGREKMFGRVYYNLGDIYYYIDNNLNTAKYLYGKAEQNLYKNTDLSYKVGYIDYLKKTNNFKDALLRFASVLGEDPENRNALYAMATTLYYRDDYSAAQGYYLQLLDKLENERNNLPFINPYTNPEHRALIEYLVRVYNNLGVTLYKLKKRTGDTRKYTEALVDLTKSSEFYDILTRNQESMVRTKTKNLAFLNQDALLRSDSKFSPQVYLRLQKDLSGMGF